MANFSELPTKYHFYNANTKNEPTDFPIPALAPAVSMWLLEGFRTRGLTMRAPRSIEVFFPTKRDGRAIVEALFKGGVLLSTVPQLLSYNVPFDFLHQGGQGNLAISTANKFPIPEVYRNSRWAELIEDFPGGFSVYRGHMSQTIVLPPQEV